MQFALLRWRLTREGVGGYLDHRGGRAVTQQERKTLILGIGNTLLSDEGAGVHAIRLLGERLPNASHVTLLDGGTLSFTLAGPIEDADHLIVIDAAELQAPPGTVRVFVEDDMDHFVGYQKKSSVHEVGLQDLLTIARLTDQLPARRALIGIQPELIDWGEEPTRAVREAIPVACDRAQELVEAWRA